MTTARCWLHSFINSHVGIKHQVKVNKWVDIWVNNQETLRIWKKETFDFAIIHRQPGEPAVENGLFPYLGCALQFGTNPLQFLRSRQKKYGHIFTCKIAGQYIHFLCDPFSYHSVIRQGRHLDWKKFHFSTSVKVTGLLVVVRLSEMISPLNICLNNLSFLVPGIWPWQFWPSPWLHNRKPPPNFHEDPAGGSSDILDRGDDGPLARCHAQVRHSGLQQGPLAGGWYLCFLLQG